MTGDDDTLVAPLPKDDSAIVLARISSDVDILADVLSRYPERHPAVWESAEWAKDLKDLGVTCERLHHFARQLEEIAGRIRRSTAPTTTL